MAKEVEDGVLLFLDEEEYSGLSLEEECSYVVPEEPPVVKTRRSSSSCRNRPHCIEHQHTWDRIAPPNVDHASEKSDPEGTSVTEDGEKHNRNMNMEEPPGQGAYARGRMGSTASIASMASMDQGQLAEQLALVQDMVQEMKQTFTGAMEELAKTQYGDDSLHQQVNHDRERSNQQINDLTEVIQSLKNEVESLKVSVREISSNQKLLDDRLKQSLKGDTKHHTSSAVKEMGPMVRPYLASLHQQKSSSDDNDNDLVTALACKSLNLSQALHEKCLHLEASASSEEEEPMRAMQMPAYSMMNSEANYFVDDKSHLSWKTPPHHRVMEEVQREKSAHEIVEAERTYCSQLWNIIDGYINPLQQADLMGIRESYSLFPAYLPQLYEQHCVQLRKMEERLIKWKTNGMLGDIFVKMTDSSESDGLSLYKEYINDFSSIINNMNKWFSQSPDFREFMGSSCLATSNVIPLLLAPLQQIPKYSLLIKNLVKHTGTDHPDRYYLESVLSRLKNFLNVMNEELELAMQYLNVSKPINRSRECGNSTRSSNSSGDANQISSARDSGIHSNGEELSHRHPVSPNTSRSYVLQVLREKRGRESSGPRHRNYRERPMSVPPRPNMVGYSSHPDLTNQEFTEYIDPGQDEIFVPYQSGHKMYSSLSKIAVKNAPEPRSPEKPPRRIRIRRRPDHPQIPINSNYMQPLAPHFPFTSSPLRHGYMNGEAREGTPRRRGPCRPSSSIDFTGRDTEKKDRMLEQWSYLDSPRDQPGEGRARNELHLSLQKLIAERDKNYEETAKDPPPPPHFRQSQYEEDSTPHSGDEPSPDPNNEQFFEPVQVENNDSNINTHYRTNDLMSGRGSRQTFQQKMIDDYGVYGDEDEDDSYRDESHNQSHMTENYNTQKETKSDIQFNNHPHKPSGVEHPRQKSLVSTLSTNKDTSCNVPKRCESTKMDFKSGENPQHNSDKQVNPNLFVPVTSNRSERRKLPSNMEAQQSMQRRETESEDSGHSFVQRDAEKSLEVTETKNVSNDSDEGQDAAKILPKKPFESQSESVQIRNSGAVSPSSTNGASNLRTPKKLPSLKGRYSQPNLEQIYSASKLPSPPLSPTESKGLKVLAKDTKIPMYAAHKRDKRSKTPDNLSKSTEDVSRSKRKTKFDSIKSFFGRKRKTSKYKVRASESGIKMNGNEIHLMRNDVKESSHMFTDSEVVNEDDQNETLASVEQDMRKPRSLSMHY